MQIDPELERLVKEGRHVAAFNLLQERRRRAGQGERRQRAPFDELLHDMWELRRRGTPVGAVLTLFFVTLAIVVLLILGLTAVGLGISEWTFFPAVDRVISIVWPLVFLPGVLPSLAAGVFVFGLVMAHRFRSPMIFVCGISGVSVGLVCFSLFPLSIRLLQQRASAEAELPLLIVGGVVSFLVFVVGLQLVLRANR